MRQKGSGIQCLLLVVYLDAVLHRQIWHLLDSTQCLHLPKQWLSIWGAGLVYERREHNMK